MESMQVIELFDLSALRLQCDCGASVSYPLTSNEDIVQKLLTYRCPLHNETKMKGPIDPWKKFVSQLSEAILQLRMAPKEASNVKCLFEVSNSFADLLEDPEDQEQAEG
jgi:hypothetical protein